MICYECNREGKTNDAVGLCHHCSAALCGVHAHAVDDPVTVSYPVNMEVVLPKHARLILCEICRDALQQEHGAS